MTEATPEEQAAASELRREVESALSELAEGLGYSADDVRWFEPALRRLALAGWREGMRTPRARSGAALTAFRAAEPDRITPLVNPRVRRR